MVTVLLLINHIDSVKYGSTVQSSLFHLNSLSHFFSFHFYLIPTVFLSFLLPLSPSTTGILLLSLPNTYRSIQCTRWLNYGHLIHLLSYLSVKCWLYLSDPRGRNMVAERRWTRSGLGEKNFAFFFFFSLFRWNNLDTCPSLLEEPPNCEFVRFC